MKPLYVLLGSFIFSILLFKLLTGDFDYSLSGRISMSVMLIFASVGHYIFPDGMAMMIPGFIPYKKLLVYFTGLIEDSAAAGLLIHSLQHVTSILLIIYFVLILPANINAAMNHIDLEKASDKGPGIKYLWFRVPLQIVFIAWTYFSGLY